MKNEKSIKVVSVDVSKIVDDNNMPIDIACSGKLRRWLIGRYSGKEVYVPDNCQIIRFGNEELRASIKRRGKEQREIYADLDNLLKNSAYVGYELGDAKHPNIDRQDIYYAVADIGGVIFGVRFKIDVRKGHEQGRYKDHKVVKLDGAEKIIKRPPSPYQGFSPSGIEGGRTMPFLKVQEAMGINSNIIQNTTKVNI